MTVVPLHPEPVPVPAPLPVRPRPSGGCIVPGCGKPTRLYAGGWLCDDHKPGRAAAPAVEAGSAA